jgi:predicted alpha/beta-hydrolase family hydrolase
VRASHGQGCFDACLSKLSQTVADACAQYHGRPIYLVGQSFGGRAWVHFVAGCMESRSAREDGSERWPWAADPIGSKSDPSVWPHAAPLPAQVKGVIALGYPLFHAKYNRIKPLLLLPSSVNIMFVVGTSDTTSLGKLNVYQGDSVKTMAMFTDTIAEMACKDNVVLHAVPGGGHNPFEGPKQTQDANNAETVRAVAAFVAQTSV